MISTNQLQMKFFPPWEHPYRKYEQLIEATLRETDVILDAGCGRTAPILKKFRHKAGQLIGVDLEEPMGDMKGVKYIKGDISSIDLPDNSVDVVISRAVLEHIRHPDPVFKEINRVLKSGGRFIFLVPNLGDYVSIISKIVPNKFHQKIVSKTEGRDQTDVFQAYYKANTYASINRIGGRNGFIIERFHYIGQYPSAFMFNRFLFLLATIYEKVISRFDVLKFLRGWLLVELKKKEGANV